MTERTYAFAGPDFQKLFAGFQFPGFSTEAMVAAQQKTMEAFGEANTAALAGVQAIAARQTEIWQEAVNESAKALKDFAGAKTMSDVAQKQRVLTKSVMEKGFDNMRELGELTFETQTKVVDVLGKRFVESVGDLAQNGAAKTRK